MKTNNYLALCLEQAAQSPLHYRHGAIIVRGGKIIGKGYNDYRSGFDGGALKTGKIAQDVYDGPAIAELKHKMKNKSKSKPKDNVTTGGVAVNAFVPFETMNGGGHHANTPLSMHSEMMAIHSALSSSSTMASTSVSSVKPSFKLPGKSKHTARLRNERLRVYVEAVCRAALEDQTKTQGGKSQVQEWRFEASASQPRQVGQGVSQPQGSGRGAGGHGGGCGETREEEERTPRHASKATRVDKVVTSVLYTNPTEPEEIVKTTDDHAPVQKPNYPDHKQVKKPPDKSIPKFTPSLKPVGLAGAKTTSVFDRTRSPRLNGADLYVARFGGLSKGGKDASQKLRPKRPSIPTASAEPPDPLSRCSSRSLASDGSLHDELVNPHPKTHVQPAANVSVPLDITSIHASRPCYRCVTYMHNVGIRRVFWTTDSGEWQSAKVRDLVDTLNGVGGDASSSGCGMFVTKHEMLMMRRLLGAG